MSKRTLLRIAVFALVFFVPLTIYLAPGVAAAIYTTVAALAPLWLPVGLLALSFPLWLTFARSQYVARVPYATIELKPGPETPRTAKAMELVFYALYYRTPVTRLALLLGQVRLPWSFEIAAENHTVRFFIHLPIAHRAAVEARIRTEYPDIDIDEARDYAREFDFNPFAMRLKMREYTLAKPDPYPLKTYPTYEESKDSRDLFAELLADLVAVGEGERLFISFIVMPHQREYPKLWKRPEDTLHSDAEREIAHILGHEGNLNAISKAKQHVVAAIERALQKPSFDVGVRALYLAERKQWSEERADMLDTLLDRFSDTELNSFKAYDPRDQVGWPLSEVFAAAPVVAMNYFVNVYRRRAFFAPPYYGRKFVLNTEELATVYHLPHLTRASPLSRARSRRLDPPDNLPVLTA